MLKMGLKKLKICSLWSVSIWGFVVLSLLVNMVQCQNFNDYEVNNPDVLPLVTTLVNSRLSNLTTVLSKDISKQASFCIKDPWVFLLFFPQLLCMLIVWFLNWIVELLIALTCSWLWIYELIGGSQCLRLIYVYTCVCNGIGSCFEIEVA